MIDITIFNQLNEEGAQCFTRQHDKNTAYAKKKAIYANGNLNPKYIYYRYGNVCGSFVI